MLLVNSLNYKAILRIIGIITFLVSLSMIIPWIYAGATGDVACAEGFKKCIPGLFLLGSVGIASIQHQKVHLRSREGYIVVAACWTLASFYGAFPYYFSGYAENFIDALFESTSGFTTTGCTAISMTVLPKSLMLWKAISHWIGGMGILVFIISILPALGVNGQLIARAEAPGPVFEKMTVRMSDSAKILYVTYISFTIIEFMLLAASPSMDTFDAVINTLGSISTGGLVPHPEGIAYYDSLYVEIVISIFCILASVNFILYHYAFTGKFQYIFKDIELRAFLLIIVIAIMVSAFSLACHSDLSFSQSLRESFFQVISMSTTSGYTRSPYMTWPTTCQFLLILLMFIGGCGASTAGSIKVIRVLIMLKLIWRGGIKRIHPRSVVAVKFKNSGAIPAPVVSAITMFILTYFFLFVLSAVLLSFQGLDMETTLTASIAMLSNTGASFGEAGLIGNFSMFHPLLKLYLCALMVIGRLEMFPIIVLFTKNFWGKDR